MLSVTNILSHTQITTMTDVIVIIILYTPLSETCSQSRVFISPYNINHRQYREHELSSMIHAALTRVTPYHIQISEKNTCRHRHTGISIIIHI